MANDSMQDVYTSLTSWREIDVEALASAMRVAYETYKNDKEEWDRLQSLSKEKAENYTIEKIGQTMKELLNV